MADMEWIDNALKAMGAGYKPECECKKCKGITKLIAAVRFAEARFGKIVALDQHKEEHSTAECPCCVALVSQDRLQTGEVEEKP